MSLDIAVNRRPILAENRASGGAVLRFAVPAAAGRNAPHLGGDS
jgi:hypothetical protein